jgi:hypothetical protein
MLDMIGWFHYLLERQKKRRRLSKRIEEEEEGIISTSKIIEVQESESRNITVKDPKEDQIQVSDEVEENVQLQQRQETKSVESFSHNETIYPRRHEENAWMIIGGSTVGKSHLKDKLPCQDNHFCLSLDKGWGIVLSSDGAGSATNSQMGSKYITNGIGPKIFKELIQSHEWNIKNTFPSSEEWEKLAREAFIHLYESLKKFADDEKIELSSLACTLTALIYSPLGLLVSHVGDGRAGYLGENKMWKPIITPHKGEESNQTVFLTSNRWIKEDLLMSNVKVPESNVILDKPAAFTLMTDGCEQHAFECSILNKETNKWTDPNLPYPKFFDPLVRNMRMMNDAEVPAVEANKIWLEFLERGTKGLAKEPDDKTMILGILL